MDEIDDQDVEYKPMVVVRTMQPWRTKISRLDPVIKITTCFLIKLWYVYRTANIPGYTGCVHWSNRKAAHSNMPKPEPTSTARVHR